MKKSYKITLQQTMPSMYLSTGQLVQRIKAMSKDRQSAYSLFVKERGLSPEIDMSAFVKIWNSVKPLHHKSGDVVMASPTHHHPDLAFVVVLPVHSVYATYHGVTVLDFDGKLHNLSEEQSKALDPL